MNNILKQFNAELNLICKSFYNCEHEDEVFTIIERTWVGIFNNAIVKTYPFVPVMQEFSVWEDGKPFGRSDLLFQWGHEGQIYDVLVEAKCWEWNGKWNTENNLEFYKPIFAQAAGYHVAEYDTYNNKVLYMALVFEWMRNTRKTGITTQASSLLENYSAGNVDDKVTSFLSFNNGDNSGVLVYGSISEFISIIPDKESIISTSTGEEMTEAQER